MWTEHKIPQFVAGESVLDAGCGTGRLIPKLKVVGYVGLDSSEAMLSHAKGREGRATLCEGDIMHLPFVDGCFDTVIASDVLLHLTDEETSRALREMCRVTRIRLVATFQRGGAYDYNPSFFSRQHEIEDLRKLMPEALGFHVMRLYDRTHLIVAEKVSY